MDHENRSYGIAVLGTVLVAAGFAAATTTGLGSPNGLLRTGGIETLVGAAAPFSNPVVLSPPYVIALALAETALLVVWVTWSDVPLAGRRSLEAGALLGGLSMLPMVSAGFFTAWTVELLTELSSIRFASDYVTFAGPSTFLVGLGALATGLGALVAALGPLDGDERTLLAGTAAVVLAGAAAAAFATGYTAWPTVFAAGPTYAGVGVYAVALAGLLALATQVRRDGAHWLVFPLALVGVVAAVFGLLDGEIRGGTLAALVAVVTLWAFWTLAPGDWSTLEPVDSGTESTP